MERQQQQQLLIILGVMLVGIALVVGIQMLGENTAAANLDAVIADCTSLAIRAQTWYKRPSILEGAGRSFAYFSLSAIGADSVNAHGTYSISRLTEDSFVLTGTGIEDPNRDGNPLTVSFTVYADALSAPIITY
ncbi:MAG: hypothetical protein DRP97_01300 [Candidatus Latescibacterota bacterium]|nr:hypothetical protein [Candidatus Latescibacterota bacterium]RKY71966.1 MAG: hypothetical protein DRP97_01300 [Candidatus Latescibacterota bacterium]